RHGIAATALASSICLLLAPAAMADRPGGGGSIGGGSDTSTSGDASDDGTLSSTAGVIVYDRSKNGTGSSVGPVTSTTSWTPPACWYAPKYTPAQLKAY